MHDSSLDKMKDFRAKYLDGKENENLTILDIGSFDVNGTYKPIFDSPQWQYIGADMCPGANVDIVLDNPYNWHSIKTNSMDIVISGQAFEHIEYFWVTILEIARVLKPEGLCCIIAPSSGCEHKYPVDCWRFYPDGFSALARFANLQVLDAFTQWDNQGYQDSSDEWHDSVLVARKKPASWQQQVTQKLLMLLMRIWLKSIDVSHKK